MENNILKDKKILIIEDELPIAKIMKRFIENNEAIVQVSYKGEIGLKLIEEFKPDILILDLMLPDMDGFEICKIVTEKYNIPIMMITAKNHIEDKLKGLSIGADDYITKPFDMREVIMRMKNILKRIESTEKRDKCIGIIKLNENITINVNEHKVIKGGISVEFTPKEYELLKYLSENKLIVFSREQLLDSIWGLDFEGDKRTVDIHVQRIRKKLGATKEKPIIETVFGVGYKMV